MNEEKYIVPSATLSERPEEYELKIVMPGVGKGDADLHMEGKTLTLKTHAKYQNPAGFKQIAQKAPNRFAELIVVQLNRIVKATVKNQ